jgi:hypothetical protein
MAKQMHTLYLVGGGNAAVPEGRFEAWDESRLMERKESRCISPAISVITPERAPNSEGMKLDISFVVYLYCAIYFEMFFSFSNSIFLSSSSSLFSYIQGRLSSNIGPKGCDASSPYQNCVHLSPQTLKITFIINNNICCCLLSVLYSNNLASSFTLHILVYHTLQQEALFDSKKIVPACLRVVLYVSASAPLRSRLTLAAEYKDLCLLIPLKTHYHHQKHTQHATKSNGGRGARGIPHGARGLRSVLKTDARGHEHS